MPRRYVRPFFSAGWSRTEKGCRVERWRGGTDEAYLFPTLSVVGASFGATQISADGTFIIGQVGDATNGQAIAYLKRDGVYAPELLTGLLIRQGLDLMGWKIWAVTSMSPDGRVLGGMAFDTNGARQGFVAVLPVPDGSTLEPIARRRLRRNGFC